MSFVYQRGTSDKYKFTLVKGPKASHIWLTSKYTLGVLNPNKEFKMTKPNQITPETLTKADFGSNLLRREIADQLGLKISTVYAWVSNSRDVPDKHVQSVCNVINTFNYTMADPGELNHNTGR